MTSYVSKLHVLIRLDKALIDKLMAHVPIHLVLSWLHPLHNPPARRAVYTQFDFVLRIYQLSYHTLHSILFIAPSRTAKRQRANSPPSQRLSTMSDLQRAFAKAKISGLPPVVPQPLVELPEGREEEERDLFGELRTERSDDDSSSASSASSTGTIRPSSAGRTSARPNRYDNSSK